MSGDLGLTDIVANQDQKEVTANANFQRLEDAITDFYTANLTSGDLDLSDAAGITIVKSATAIVTSGNAVSRVLTVPQIKRLLAIKNGGSATLTIRRGTTDLSLTAGRWALVYTDATANGLSLVDPATPQTNVGTIYDGGFLFDLTPAASDLLGRMVLGQNVTIAANMAGSYGAKMASIGVNPTSSFAIDVQDNGVSIGTITVSTGGVASFATSGGTAKNVDAGHTLSFHAPVTPDATIAYWQFVIAMLVR